MSQELTITTPGLCLAMKTRAPSGSHTGAQQQLRAVPATAKHLRSYSTKRKG